MVFPVYISKGGDTYGFCPAKATWDHEITNMFRVLLIAAETGCMINTGGIAEQPEWWIDLLAWFLPRYNNAKFFGRVQAIVGDGKAVTKTIGGLSGTK